MLSFDLCYWSISFNIKITGHQTNREPAVVVLNDMHLLSVCFSED